LTDLRFYLDENLSPVIAEQLILYGIDAVSARDLGELGDEDEHHLQRAAKKGRALCTQDQDFLRMAVTMTDHAGIVFAQQFNASVGGWVRALRALHARMDAEDVQGQVVFLSLRG